MRNFILAIMFVIAGNAYTHDYFYDVLFMVSLFTLLPTVDADMNLTDEWSYDTTNAQTILGFTSTALILVNFVVGYEFWRKIQDIKIRVLKARIRDVKLRSKEAAMNSSLIKEPIIILNTYRDSQNRRGIIERPDSSSSSAVIVSEED